MLTASGHRKQVVVTPLIAPGSSSKQVVLVHLFHERTAAEGIPDIIKDALPAGETSVSPADLLCGLAPGESKLLTLREIEVLGNL